MNPTIELLKVKQTRSGTLANPIPHGGGFVLADKRGGFNFNAGFKFVVRGSR